MFHKFEFEKEARKKERYYMELSIIEQLINLKYAN